MIGALRKWLAGSEPVEAALSRARTAFDAGDIGGAFDIWHALAHQGVARAQANLGGLFATGNGVERDDDEAARWFRIAAEAGDSVAQQNLALLYYEGRGTDGDLTQAAHWYARAAEAGESEAQNMLSWMAYEGVGMERDVALARQAIAKAGDFLKRRL